MNKSNLKKYLNQHPKLNKSKLNTTKTSQNLNSSIPNIDSNQKLSEKETFLRKNKLKNLSRDLKNDTIEKMKDSNSHFEKEIN